ncbi:hypothetical protein B0H13DRAFT_1885789 [Mycena leptocephala]|nr:hypothetical protein B0H13DRAFT_1885789 [Mycena leptocephala]
MAEMQFGAVGPTANSVHSEIPITLAKSCSLLSADMMNTRKPLIFNPALSLGVYDDVSVTILQGRPYGPHWEQFLLRLDVQALFKLSLRSSDMFRVVMGAGWWTSGSVVQAEFTVFGVAEEMDEYSVVELTRPDWDENGSDGQELGVRFDIQLAVIRDIVLAYDLSWEPCYQTTTWTAVFLTCTLAVLEIPDEYTDRSYILDVIKVDAMYKNMD